MEMKLGGNIRDMRKARGLTQEQLAEVLGVTVGAVYKWESNQSLPGLPLIMEMADFFDTSVDALLGHEMKDNRLNAAEARIWRCHSEKDPAGVAEVEKALKKYPNAFGIAHAGACLYHGLGLEAGDRGLLRRALTLYERARQLLPQNRDASISDQTLCGAVAQVHFALGEVEKSIEIIKRHNAGHLYSAMIGVVLAAELRRPEEAAPYLSRALTQVFNNVIYTVFGYSEVYRARRDFQSGSAILRWGIGTLRGLKATEQTDYIDKICAFALVNLAGFQLEAGDSRAARGSLERAAALARAFDAAPDYSATNLRFLIEGQRSGAFYDILGATAVEAVENALRDIDSPALWALYREI